MDSIEKSSEYCECMEIVYSSKGRLPFILGMEHMVGGNGLIHCCCFHLLISPYMVIATNGGYHFVACEGHVWTNPVWLACCNQQLLCKKAHNAGLTQKLWTSYQSRWLFWTNAVCLVLWVRPLWRLCPEMAGKEQNQEPARMATKSWLWGWRQSEAKGQKCLDKKPLCLWVASASLASFCLLRNVWEVNQVLFNVCVNWILCCVFLLP